MIWTPVLSMGVFYFCTMIDYIVVGLGLAGLACCEQLKARKKSILVFEDESQRSSTIAGGLYNPVVLKRFTKVWRAGEQLRELGPFYKTIADRLGIEIDQPMRVLRRFSSVEEQNSWFEAADRPELSPYLSTRLISSESPCIDAPFGFGEVLGTGRIHTNTLVNKYRAYLKDSGRLISEKFLNNSLVIKNNYVEYNHIKARRVIFCEGFGIKENPYFGGLPLQGSKGELLTIHAHSLKLKFVLKSSVFIIPIGDDRYWVGATYHHNDKTLATTEKARKELLRKLQTFLRCDFKLIDQAAGIRPTVSDRRPFLGTHPVYRQLSILNGLGSRGAMIAPWASKKLIEHLEEGPPLPKEANIVRFGKTGLV